MDLRFVLQECYSKRKNDDYSFEWNAYIKLFCEHLLAKRTLIRSCASDWIGLFSAVFRGLKRFLSSQMLRLGPANRNFGDGWVTDSALLFNRGRPDSIFMCCWKPLKTAVELSFQTPCFWLCCRWFWVVFSWVTLFSLDSLFTVFFCQLLRISIRTHQPPSSPLSM